MKTKLTRFIEGQIGQAGIILIAGLVMFVIGVLCALVWSLTTKHPGGWLAAGLILGAGGVILLALGGRSGG